MKYKNFIIILLLTISFGIIGILVGLLIKKPLSLPLSFFFGILSGLLLSIFYLKKVYGKY